METNLHRQYYSHW